jgi:hypothetical protein
VQPATQPNWVWEKTDVRHSGSSGDIAKLFKNEGVAHPGVMASNAPSDEATLAAREVIQNSWDAARELQTELGAEGIDAPPFEIDFIFNAHLGSSKKKLSAALDLAGLATQLKKVSSLGTSARSAIGLRDSSCLDSIGNPKIAVSSLTIIERGATGMYGKFDQAQSKLYLALISIGYTKKAEGSGGSYGYGKAGLVGASATRTVVAYTCFRERDDDPGVTRRLIGMTYWGQHEVEGSSFTGFARYGRFTDGWSQPFENGEADDIARSLGLETRCPDKLRDLGTTFLLLDPLIEPDDLRVAIERNWWPAITDNLFTARVQSKAGSTETETFEVRPARDAILKSFIRGYELATTAQDNALTHEVSKSLGKSPKTADALPLGRLGLLAKLDGWSYSEFHAPESPMEAEASINEELFPASDDESVRPSSLVALVRGPRMIVEYLEYAPGKAPFIRGTFVADEAVDELLRQTEPKAHDSWQVRGAEEGVDKRAPIVALAVTRKIKAGIAEFQKKLRPPPPAAGDVRLPIFSDLFQKLTTGKDIKLPPLPKGQPDISVKFANDGLRSGIDDSVSYKATIRFRLTDTFKKGDSAEVTISIEYCFIEDGRRGRSCNLTIKPPPGFTQIAEGEFVGVLAKKSVSFLVTTDPYSADWTGRITAVGKLKAKQDGGTVVT